MPPRPTTLAYYGRIRTLRERKYYSVAVFNKPQLHNIRCRVQTRMARAIFAAVKPTQALTTLSRVLKTDSPKFYKSPTRFAVLKTASSNFCKPPARFADLKTDFPNFNKPPTCVGVLKMDSPNFYKPLTRRSRRPRLLQMGQT